MYTHVKIKTVQGNDGIVNVEIYGLRWSIKAFIYCCVGTQVPVVKYGKKYLLLTPIGKVGVLVSIEVPAERNHRGTRKFDAFTFFQMV